jgi:VPS62-like protein
VRSNPTTAAPERTRRPRWGLCALALLLPCLPLSCFHAFNHGPEPAIRVVTDSAPLTSDTSPPMSAGRDLDGDGLDDALEAEIARRHAPRWRFTGRDPEGPALPQNRDERYFPMSVARFLACLESGLYDLDGGRVVAAAPGTFDDEAVAGFPSYLAGDPPGRAPLYTHVYPGAEGEAFCEYWAFYGYDHAGATVLGVDVPYGGHRGDWEHVAFRVSLDPPRLLEGFYYGHARCLVVKGEDLERVAGEHPLVYVSQGKHASYPAACVIQSVPFVPQAVIGHHDVANGRGRTWDGWEGPLIDLGERDRPRGDAKRWLGFEGRWGPDGFEIGGLDLGVSPTGPAAKSSWGNNTAGDPWRAALEARGRLLGEHESRR